MNRSILIVICDFLLLSLLTFSTDINHMADENTRPPTTVVVATNTPVSAGNDLAAVMKLALEQERQNTRRLQEQLAAARQSAARQQTQWQEQLAARQEANARLQQQLAAAQTNLEDLQRRLQDTFARAQQAQQQLQHQAAEAQHQAELAATLRRQLDELARSNQLAQAEKQQLLGQLQLAETRERAASEKAALLQQEAAAARAENARLAESFQTLATNATQLAQTLRANTPLAPNAIFNGFVSNRVAVSILAARTSFFAQDTTRNKNTETVLATDGTNIFAVCHVQDTPLTLWDPGTDWDRLSGTLTRGAVQVPIHSLAFDAQDPRVVLLPVSPDAARQLGGKIYRLSSDPYKFQDAVLVGANEGYYGECNFQIDERTPSYVKLDRSLLRGLFGKFNPSRGDLVFSRTGELLGIMVNDTYCLTLRGFAAAATLAFDQDLRSRHTGETLAQLYDTVFQLPPRLQ
ncbi:MAG TPA: hypothetical protein VFB55_10005 [Verrucomicrobiae bacterium]|nr:hypothetical protein [Verrucomicrobiae bacterium]